MPIDINTELIHEQRLDPIIRIAHQEIIDVEFRIWRIKFGDMLKLRAMPNEEARHYFIGAAKRQTGPSMLEK